MAFATLVDALSTQKSPGQVPRKFDRLGFEKLIRTSGLNVDVIVVC